jgi:hypothetical protein
MGGQDSLRRMIDALMALSAWAGTSGKLVSVYEDTRRVAPNSAQRYGAMRLSRPGILVLRALFQSRQRQVVPYATFV